MTLEDLYFVACRTGPNIGEHCPTLRLLASECESVVEFGTDLAVSTTALLAGQPKQLTTFDVRPSPAAEALKTFSGDTIFEIIRADSLSYDIDSAFGTPDMLLIDSKHTFAQLSAELSRWESRVKRWIVLHDTVTFGDTGEDGTRGLTAAISQFLADHREWGIVAEYRNSHGLTVMRRNRKTRVHETTPSV